MLRIRNYNTSFSVSAFDTWCLCAQTVVEYGELLFCNKYVLTLVVWCGCFLSINIQL